MLNAFFTEEKTMFIFGNMVFIYFNIELIMIRGREIS